MIDFTALMAGMTADGDTSSVTVTEDWLQGRTIHGGLSAAFCLTSVGQQFGDLPPLRSAQFGFVGPAEGTVMIRPTVLRRGKSTVFVGVDLFAEAGLATRATLCYGTSRASAVGYGSLAAPTVPEPETCPPFFRKIPGLNFIQHFEGRFAGGHPPFSQVQHPNFSLWMRHQDPAKPASVAALVSLADAAPPAALVLFERPGPMSTMTWSIDLLTDRFETSDGWWLLQTKAENVVGGYSSQATTLWNADRQPVLVSRQNVAVFM
ncbi:MAG TPA: thioesterase family protein [Afipia sp.]